MQNKIVIPAKKIESSNSQGVIKITPEAMDALIDVVNETGLSMRSVASLIIIQAVNNDLIEYERK